MRHATRLLAALSLTVIAVAAAGCPGESPPSDTETEDEVTTEPSAEEPAERASALAHELLIVDTHVDLPYRLNDGWEDVTVHSPDGHFDAVRAREGGLDAPFMSIYVPADLGEGREAFDHAEAMIDLVERLATDHPETFRLATSPAEVRQAFADGVIALPMGMENGAAIGDDLANLEHFHGRGIRYVTLTHSANNQISDSSYAEDDRWGGLSPFGREVVVEMNRLGILVDVSHLSDEAVAEAVEISRVPVIASHSSCRHFTPGFERNLSDELIRAIAAKSGVVQVNFGSAFVTEEANRTLMEGWKAVAAWAEEHGVEEGSPEAEAYTEEWKAAHPFTEPTLADVADHIDHVVSLVGVDHVGIGSDFDGVSAVPVGLEDVSTYPALLAELLRRGYSEEDLRKIAGENLMRVWEAAEQAAG
jgi:membrane dipeptidase